MGRILETVEQWLQKDEWSFEPHPEKPIIRTSVQGASVSFRMYFQAREDQEQLMVYTIGPNLVPEAQRAEVMEYLTRANYGLIIGNFEMDLSDGEVRYKVSVDVEGSKLVPLMVKNMIGASVSMMDRYYPGALGIAFGGKKAAEAIKEAEG